MHMYSCLSFLSVLKQIIHLFLLLQYVHETKNKNVHNSLSVMSSSDGISSISSGMN